MPAPPVDPLIVVRPFAPAMHNWLPSHRGVDLATHAGQEVVAVRAGRIVVSEVIAGRPVVVLRSGGVRFTFEPVVASVPVGTRVRSGEAMGVVAAGGHCGSGCLHWGAKIGGSYADPLTFLPRVTPVLKPVRGHR